MRVVDQALKYAPDLDNIDLTGWGETLLNKELFDIVRAFKSAGANSVTFTTNGEMLDEKVCEKILETGVNAVSISVDAAEEATYRKIKSSGKLKQVIRNISRLAKMRKSPNAPYISSSFIMMRSNISEMAKFAALMAVVEANEVAFKNLSGIWSKAALEELVFEGFQTPNDPLKNFEELKNSAIEAGESTGIKVKFYGDMQAEFLGTCGNGAHFRPFISAGGDVHPCCVLAYPINRIGRDGNSFPTGVKTFGNVMDKELDKIWRKLKYRRFRASLSLNRPSLPKDCRECMVRYSVF